MEKAKQPIRYVLSSVSSFLLDAGLFYVLKLLLGTPLGVYAEPVCNVAARAASSFFNFNLNNRLVFGNTGSYGKALLRYYCLVGVVALLMTVLLNAFTALLRIGSPEGKALTKMVIDAGLFVVSFFGQKYWVFHKADAAGS